MPKLTLYLIINSISIFLSFLSIIILHVSLSCMHVNSWGECCLVRDNSKKPYHLFEWFRTRLHSPQLGLIASHCSSLIDALWSACRLWLVLSNLLLGNCLIFSLLSLFFFLFLFFRYQLKQKKMQKKNE